MGRAAAACAPRSGGRRGDTPAEARRAHARAAEVQARLCRAGEMQRARHERQPGLTPHAKVVWKHGQPLVLQFCFKRGLHVTARLDCIHFRIHPASPARMADAKRPMPALCPDYTLHSGQPWACCPGRVQIIRMRCSKAPEAALPSALTATHTTCYIEAGKEIRVTRLSAPAAAGVAKQPQPSLFRILHPYFTVSSLLNSI